MGKSRSLRLLTLAVVVFSLFFQSVLPAGDVIDPRDEGSGGFIDDDNSQDDDDTEGSGTTVAMEPKQKETRLLSETKGNSWPTDATSVSPAPSITSNSKMSNNQAQGFFEKTEVLAAVIAGGAVGVVLAVLLVVLLVHRLKKKDAGSYALEQSKSFQAGYQKAPTQEIYA